MLQNKPLLLIVFISLWFNVVWADGLLRPKGDYYPKDLLQNRLTKIDVTIKGQIAETEVYQ